MKYLLLLFLAGCAYQSDTKPTLKLSPYGGDPFLYRTDQILFLSYGQLDEFVKWERNFRPLINDARIRASADNIRINERRWVTNAICLRNAYAKIPDANVQDDIIAQLKVITDAITLSIAYMNKHPIALNSPP